MCGPPRHSCSLLEEYKGQFRMSRVEHWGEIAGKCVAPSFD
jgi:hypothetical protein